MSYEEYWEKDATLVRAYRKADVLSQKRKNDELWLQGMYFYEALVDVAPVLRAFAKNGTKPHPYPEKPYELQSSEKPLAAGEDKPEDHKKMLTGKAAFEAWALHYNREFEKKKVEEVKDNA